MHIPAAIITSATGKTCVPPPMPNARSEEKVKRANPNNAAAVAAVPPNGSMEAAWLGGMMQAIPMVTMNMGNINA